MCRHMNIKMTKNNTSKPHNKKKLIVLIVAILVLVAAGSAFAYHRNRTTSNAAKPTNAGQTTNYVPATNEEKKQSEDVKDKIVNDKNNPPTPTPAGDNLSVTPVISSASFQNGEAEVNAYIPGVVEDGGTCTLTASLGTSSFTRTTKSIANASNSVCPSFLIERSAFASTGKWTVKVNYASDRAKGSSDNVVLEVK
jgi:hypothetical protein